MFECDDPSTGIYCILNKENNKRYVGQARCLRERCKDHRGDLYRGTHFNDYLQNSFNLHGEEIFDFIVLEHCTIEELNEREKYYMKVYDVKNRDHGYNLKDGGQNCKGTFCDEVKEKLSKSITESFKDPKRREIQSQRAKEFWSRPEYREGHSGENAPMYGHHHTDEAKKKVGDANRGKSRNLVCTDKVLCAETGIVYDNSRVAYKETGIDSSCILKVCRGERKIASGYHWQFVKEESIWENKVS